MKQDTNSLWEKLSRYGDSFTPRPFVEIVKGKVKESSSYVVSGNYFINELENTRSMPGAHIEPICTISIKI